MIPASGDVPGLFPGDPAPAAGYRVEPLSSGEECRQTIDGLLRALARDGVDLPDGLADRIREWYPDIEAETDRAGVFAGTVLGYLVQVHEEQLAGEVELVELGLAIVQGFVSKFAPDNPSV